MPHLDDPFSCPALALTPPLHTILSVFVPSLRPMFLDLFVKIRGLTLPTDPAKPAQSLPFIQNNPL